MKSILRSIYLIINYKTFIVTALAVVSAYLCFRFNFIARFPDMLVGVAIVFPVVFSIGSAYNRRETALQRWADFKGHAIAVYFATRDWPSDKQNDLSVRTRDIIIKMIGLLKKTLNGTRAEWPQREVEIFKLFSELSSITMDMRKFGVQSGEVSRVSQYVSKM